MTTTFADRRDVLDVAATVALAVYSFVAALGFARVFGDWQFVGDVMVVVIVGHGASLLLRRLNVPGVAAMAITAVAVGWTIAWLSYPATFAAFFPTRETWDIGFADLSLVRDQFQTAVAPVEYIGGWSLLAMIGTAFVVLTSDTFAFYARARGEALVPGAVLFVFVAALGANRHRVGLTLLLVAAGFLAAAVLRVRFAQPPRTLLGRARHPLSIALPSVLMAGTTVVLAAWFIGPRLPGAGADALIDTHKDTGGVTEVPSPLVDIRSRLVNQRDTELFVVRATEPRYWRVSGLASFDGRIWTLAERGAERADDNLASAAPGARSNSQDIVIGALRGRLVPAAADPVSVDGEGLIWNAETASLVRTDRDLETGDRYVVVSAMPTFTVEALRAATSLNPPDPIYVELPADFPDTVAATAAAVTADAPTTYDAMIALQTWFLSEFEYSLDVPAGHGETAIEAFLRQKIGYCEQFAATFAAMARSLNIPARVAVGYTYGLDQGDGTRSVLGKNSHAWPEIWFDGLGWVPFEPTPGRGAPGSEAHTGLVPAQDESAPGPGTGDEAAAPAATQPPVANQPQPIPDLESQITPASSADPLGRTIVHPPGPPWGPISIVLLLLLAGLALPEVVRRWRRHHPSADVAKQIGDLWRRALGALEATGMRVDPSLTPNEQARAAAPRLPVAARPLKSLAAVATAATYAPPDEVAELATPPHPGEPGPSRWCRQIEHIAVDSMTAGGRLRRYFTVWQ
jgi:transglutaminase-like putative cysteine protease